MVVLELLRLPVGGQLLVLASAAVLVRMRELVQANDLALLGAGGVFAVLDVFLIYLHQK